LPPVVTTALGSSTEPGEETYGCCILQATKTRMLCHTALLAALRTECSTLFGFDSTALVAATMLTRCAVNDARLQGCQSSMQCVDACVLLCMFGAEVALRFVGATCMMPWYVYAAWVQRVCCKLPEKHTVISAPALTRCPLHFFRAPAATPAILHALALPMCQTMPSLSPKTRTAIPARMVLWMMHALPVSAVTCCCSYCTALLTVFWEHKCRPIRCCCASGWVCSECPSAKLQAVLFTGMCIVLCTLVVVCSEAVACSAVKYQLCWHLVGRTVYAGCAPCM
jgi:hypothetical protein